MGVISPVVRTGVVNVLLFCATRRILPARSVAPGWRGLFRLVGFTESNPSQDTEKSFACMGIDGKELEKGCPEGEESTPRPQLDLSPQVRIEIDTLCSPGRTGRVRQMLTGAPHRICDP